MKKYFSSLCVVLCAVFGFVPSLFAAGEIPVTMTDVIDIPALVTSYTGKLGLVVAAVIGAILTFTLIWKGVRKLRGL